MNKGKIFKLAKKFCGRAKNCIRIARERVEKALQYSYRDRRNKKRDMRSLWIQRINAGTCQHGVNYGNFMHGLMKENIQLNRKVLSKLSLHEPYSFKFWLNFIREIERVKAELKKEFEMKDLGAAKLILGCLEIRKSLTGYVLAVFGTTISWKASLQKMVALSTTEAELIALTKVFKEAI
ncbi:uncharacterized protein LOC133785129 [Humulus lupulus]|uniref:uncharacterized protein LOC133785129 n=1 Tax=Humulus lupulus TaxID=3486 RepID=UPI002B400ED2|nr:uncharacterized protein LOC133785129 [Humulus lupulus]